MNIGYYDEDGQIVRYRSAIAAIDAGYNHFLKWAAKIPADAVLVIEFNGRYSAEWNATIANWLKERANDYALQW